MHWEPVKRGMAWVGGAAVIMAALFGLIIGGIYYIDYRIEEKLKDASFVRRIAREIRPVLIFDENEHIIADNGALEEYISDLSIKPPQESEGGLVLIIRVTTKKFLSTPPILESLDFNCKIKPERQKKFDWQFKIYVQKILGLGASPPPTPNRFRLEIIP